MDIRFYKDEDYDKWDEFVDASYNGTFLHKRKFLSYHKDRFNDKSLIIEKPNGKIIAIFPSSTDENDEKCIISHPGITFGGVITNKLYGEKIIDLFEKICRFYYDLGYFKLKYKVVPQIYHVKPSQDDLYALFRIGGHRYRSDLAATIDLEEKLDFKRTRRCWVKKAIKNFVEISSDIIYLEEFWNLLTENLKNRYNAIPVHNIGEIRNLADRFPKEIQFKFAKHENRVVAGVVLFLHKKVCHVQYMANNDKGKKIGALDLILKESIVEMKEAGIRYFDFGINNEENGRILNQSLYRFKRGFNSGGLTYEFYEVNLEEVISKSD